MCKKKTKKNFFHFLLLIFFHWDFFLSLKIKNFLSLFALHLSTIYLSLFSLLLFLFSPEPSRRPRLLP